MKKLNFIIAAAALSLFVSLFYAHAQDKIRAVGMATIHKGAVDIARDKAIENAQRNAVEEKVGVMITSVSEIENYQVKLDQILSESKGFINSYKVISEKREGKNYKVTIEADIGVGKLKDRMSAIELVMLRKSKPRLMFIFGDRAQKDAIAEASMTRYFMAQGFKVIDADSVKKIKGVEELRSLISDRTGVKKIAQSYGAEIIILGKVEVVTKSFRMGDVEISANEVTVSGKV
ncbi:MAG: flagellar assembly protein T N-terminal domain-containing protein, partial [Deltaproteobacteria bacterium]|nr:flagellar assembly protein T N-terminal domain-containing protein [Deltaproteobacteria bacterium]